jgi:peptidyl-prolyl cis-trans isomerase D
MLTWINEKAKWVIVIFAAGIVVGLLAMDRVPKTNQSYPVAIVNDHKVSYGEFDTRIKRIVQNQYQGQHLEDEQYAQLRSEVFRSFVRQVMMEGLYEDAELRASVAELKNEFKRNPDAVRGRLVQEAQSRLYAIQQQATSQEDLMQRSQAYIASLPKFLVDTNFNKAEFDAWLETPAAFQWGVMLQFEEDLKNSTIPARQLQVLVGASVHPTALESKWNVDRRLTDFDIDVAYVSNSDLDSVEAVVDSAMVKGYFNAHQDSFFVDKDQVRFDYVKIPVEATEGDDARIREYAMTLYYQLSDTSSAANFEDMARISSEDPGSAENGGVLEQEAGRGMFVEEFEKAALALDSGAISEPVKTRFGYHIIKNYGKSTDSTGAVTAKVGHILLVVNASSETVDSLEAILTGIKSEVEAGKSFAEAAKAKNLMVERSSWIGHGENIADLGYLRGLAAYAWPNENLSDDVGKASPVLKNNKWVVLATKAQELKAGERDVSVYYREIEKNLIRKKLSAASAAYLTSKVDQVKAWTPAAATDSTAEAAAAAPAEIEKVKIESKNTSVDGFVPGFGYGNVNLAKVLQSQKEGEWGPVVETELGAVMVKIKGKKVAEQEAVEAAIKDDKDNALRFTSMTLFNQYVGDMEKATPVVNNLDLFYRD